MRSSICWRGAIVGGTSCTGATPPRLVSFDDRDVAASLTMQDGPATWWQSAGRMDVITEIEIDCPRDDQQDLGDSCTTQ
jgi:hypothetical protein